MMTRLCQLGGKRVHNILQIWMNILIY